MENPRSTHALILSPYLITAKRSLRAPQRQLHFQCHPNMKLHSPESNPCHDGCACICSGNANRVYERKDNDDGSRDDRTAERPGCAALRTVCTGNNDLHLHRSCGDLCAPTMQDVHVVCRARTKHEVDLEHSLSDRSNRKCAGHVPPVR